MNTQRFTQDNTHGYTPDELTKLNTLYFAAGGTDKSTDRNDHLAEQAQRSFDVEALRIQDVETSTVDEEGMW